MPLGWFSRKSCASPPAKPDDRALVRALEDRDHDRDEVHQLRPHPQELEVREQRRLQQQRRDHDDDDRHEDTPGHRLTPPSWPAARARTAASRSRRPDAPRRIPAVDVVGWHRARDLADQHARRIEPRLTVDLVARREDRSSPSITRAGLDAAHAQVVRRPGPSTRPASSVPSSDGGHGVVAVDDQPDVGRGRGHLHDAPDQHRRARPKPVTTGWSTSMPSFDPLSIVIVYSKFDTPLAITTRRHRRRVERPRSSSRSSSPWLLRSGPVSRRHGSSARSASFSCVSRSFSSASDGQVRRARRRSRRPARVTVVDGFLHRGHDGLRRRAERRERARPRPDGSRA